MGNPAQKLLSFSIWWMIGEEDVNKSEKMNSLAGQLTCQAVKTVI
jgi:hypothetical protein